jgi:hypothetical protein
MFCAIGILGRALTPITSGGALGTIGYAVALCSTDGRVDIIGAAMFGLALLFLLDLSEFARRLRGVEITGAVMSGQVGIGWGAPPCSPWRSRRWPWALPLWP